MDCNAVAARHTAEDYKKAENLMAQEECLGADILPLRYRKTLNGVERMDFESLGRARPVV